MNYEYPEVGIMFISDDLPKRRIEEIQNEIELIKEQSCERLDKFLEARGLVSEMGVIRKPKTR